MLATPSTSPPRSTISPRSHSPSSARSVSVGWWITKRVVVVDSHPLSPKPSVGAVRRAESLEVKMPAQLVAFVHSRPVDWSFPGLSQSCCIDSRTVREFHSVTLGNDLMLMA